ncbi:MAG: pyridoxal phosphate-dependent aminotransferase family protein [Flavobacteriaceae bacterium]|jgi:8-amino-7-oxononanoate synthase|nr:pyridoxal phosphate-dependent aminotransferase family protein [Flavobacteriaceae bacterium]NVJ73390.1 pyridoxal phosphate-dependent aminotransferase family protein [Flavobacteriaceae bacterium]
MKQLKRSISTKIKHKGELYTYYGGTNYLGLYHHFRFKKKMLKGVLKYGVHFGASRLSNVGLDIYKKAEIKLAEVCGAKAALTVSSGYLAGQLVASLFKEERYKSFYSPNTHPALERQKYKEYLDYESFIESVNAYIAKGPKKTPIIYLDTIDFFGNNYPTYDWLHKIPLQECILIADDSHGIGITENGTGSYGILKEFKPKELIVCCSLGKGFGIGAGAIISSKKRINKIKETSFFGGASPASPGHLYAFVKSSEIYEKQYKKLHKNIRLFLKQLKHPEEFHFHKDHPAFGFRDNELCELLEANKILMTKFNYPTEKDPLIYRIVITARHTKMDIEKLTELINTHYDSKNN